jgi:acyl-CoA synthetase (NDP forming)
VIDPIAEASRKKTVVVGVIGNRLTGNLMVEFEKARIPAYPSVQRTVSAMKALYLRNMYLGRLLNDH